jgi:hypothetical protein
MLCPEKARGNTEAQDVRLELTEGGGGEERARRRMMEVGEGGENRVAGDVVLSLAKTNYNGAGKGIVNP